jgi:hypothetical protein
VSKQFQEPKSRTGVSCTSEVRTNIILLLYGKEFKVYKGVMAYSGMSSRALFIVVI